MALNIESMTPDEMIRLGKQMKKEEREKKLADNPKTDRAVLSLSELAKVLNSEGTKICARTIGRRIEKTPGFPYSKGPIMAELGEVRALLAGKWSRSSH